MEASRTVMPFKPTAADDAPAARGGLTLLRAMGICGRSIVKCPGSAVGYNFAARLLPPVPGLARGGRTPEALRVPRNG